MRGSDVELNQARYSGFPIITYSSQKLKKELELRGQRWTCAKELDSRFTSDRRTVRTSTAARLRQNSSIASKLHVLTPFDED